MVALDESTHISDVAQQAIFIRGVDETLSVTEVFLGLVPMIDTITANDIFNSLVGVLNKMGIYWSRAVGIARRAARFFLRGGAEVMEAKALGKAHNLWINNLTVLTTKTGGPSN